MAFNVRNAFVHLQYQLVLKYFDSSIDEITKCLKESFGSDILIKNSPYYLPYLTGERTPLNDPHVRKFSQYGH